MSHQPAIPEAEHRWPASLAIVAAIAMYATLPERYALGPPWLMPALEVAVLIGLSISAPKRNREEAILIRGLAVGLIALVSAVNLFDLIQLVERLLNGTKAEGTELVFSAMRIWLTNVLVFGLWFWELDRGGPTVRRWQPRNPDFLFPQMSSPGVVAGEWMPDFVDYLYVSFTNAMAFSPTDTMPLSRWAKLLMLTQSLASLLTIAFVAARAVNILS